MKRIIIGFLSLILFTFALSPNYSNAQAEENESGKADEESVENLNDMKEALEKNELEIDMENEKNVEEKVINDEGEEVGTLGIEEVSEEPVYEEGSEEDITTFAKTIPKGVNKRYKVYWYAATVNYHFYVTVNVNKNTGLGKIVSANDGWYVAIPPGVVSGDQITIPRKNETSASAAEARYTLSMSAPVSTKLWIYGKVKNGKFTTGGN